MKNDLKVTNEDAVASINDLISKMAILEDNQRREEQMRGELREKLRVAEDQNLDLRNFIRSL